MNRTKMVFSYRHKNPEVDNLLFSIRGDYHFSFLPANKSCKEQIYTRSMMNPALCDVVFWEPHTQHALGDMCNLLIISSSDEELSRFCSAADFIAFIKLE